ncbi:MAG: DUF3137 domain-containing protein [bacterium]
MGFLESFFGPSKKEIWQQVCGQLGGRYIDRGFFQSDKMEIDHRNWTITFDTYTTRTNNNTTRYTRIRAPYINPDGFRFEIYRKSIFSSLGKLFGLQDITIGDPQFDDDFIIKSNDQYKVMALLANHDIKNLISLQPQIYFSVKDDEGWFSKKFPKGVDELYFRVIGYIKDFDRLKNVYDLFTTTLDYLCRIGSAYENDPGVEI